MSDQFFLPSAQAVLGRVINVRTEPLDEKGDFVVPFDAIPDFAKNEAPSASFVPKGPVLETGIKAVDLFAPLSPHGLTGLFGNYGLGKLVLLEEIMSNSMQRSDAVVICLVQDTVPWKATLLARALQEAGLTEKSIVIFECPDGGQKLFERMLRLGLALAAQLQAAGQAVIFVLSPQSVENGDLLAIGDDLQQLLRRRALTTMVISQKEQPDWQIGKNRPVTTPELDTWIVLSPALAGQRLYPAIDPFRSGSRLLLENGVSFEHVQLIQRARAVLKQSDRDLHAQRLQLFLTQPFTVTEPFTGKPGEYVSLQETLRDSLAIIEGQFDLVPVQSFFFIGTADQARLKKQA